MIAAYLSWYLVLVIVASLVVSLLTARLGLPAPRLIVTLFVILILSPLVVGYLYVVYFDSLPEVIVPAVTGVTLEVARERLAAVDLQGREAGQVYEPKYPEGIIISQRPEAGRNVKVGRVVNLMINSGESKVPVPNVIGQLISQAGGILQAAQLRIGDIRWEKNPGQAEGTIIAQEPMPGEQAVFGSRVDLLAATSAEVITEESSEEGKKLNERE
ncbi:MAG: PASTA domain-containing protein [Candidatus Saganbacteria bacterium]|nr:PASTA domain-containing protein [Candidatus Saganbacteria bacterium]